MSSMWSRLINLGGLVTGTLLIGNGGTGQSTKTAAFDALSPMTTAGDVIYGGTSGTGTRLAAGTSVQLLHGGTTPSWSAASLTADVSGVLPIANGGSNKGLTLAAGGLLWTDADSFEVGAAGTASDWALSGGTGAPIFSSTTTTAKMIDGSADAIQLTVQGHSTQTSDILVAEKSDGTDLLEVTNTAGTKIRGTTTNDSAAAGFVGEFMTASGSGVILTSTQNKEIAGPITLTAGDWDLSYDMAYGQNTGTAIVGTRFHSFMGTATGDNNTGIVTFSNDFDGTTPPTGAANISQSVSGFRVTVANGATQTWYVKAVTVYSAGTVEAAGRISARRVR